MSMRGAGQQTPEALPHASDRRLEPVLRHEAMVVEQVESAVEVARGSAEVACQELPTVLRARQWQTAEIPHSLASTQSLADSGAVEIDEQETAVAAF